VHSRSQVEGRQGAADESYGWGSSWIAKAIAKLMKFIELEINIWNRILTKTICAISFAFDKREQWGVADARGRQWIWGFLRGLHDSWIEIWIFTVSRWIPRNSLPLTRHTLFRYAPLVQYIPSEFRDNNIHFKSFSGRREFLFHPSPIPNWTI
jgi:hypothetical protein